MSPLKYTRRSGFSLIELLMVIAVLAILFVIVFLGVRIQLTKAQDTKIRNGADEIITALKLYRQDDKDGLVPIVTDLNARLSVSLAPLVTKGYLTNSSPLNFEGRYLSYDGESYSLTMQLKGTTYTVTDEASTGYRSASLGTVSLGKVSPGLNFTSIPGSTSTPFIVDNIAGRYPDPSTYSVWFKPTEVNREGSLDQILLGRMTYVAAGDVMNYGTGWSLALTSTGQIRLFACQLANCTTANSAPNYLNATTNLPEVSTIKPGSWTHLVLRISNNSSIAKTEVSPRVGSVQAAAPQNLTFTLYVNNIKTGWASAINSSWASGYATADIYLSGIDRSRAVFKTLPFTGTMDDFRIYKTALTTDAVSKLYNSGNGTFGLGTETGLAGLWRMDTKPTVVGSATTTEDALSSPNNAVLGGNVTWTADGLVPLAAYFNTWTDAIGRAYTIYGQ